MFENLMRQLQSPEPAERRQAISGLANLRDPRALTELANVYKNDPDPAIRELALKAGRYIKKYADPAASAGEGNSSGSTSASQSGGYSSASGFATGGDSSAGTTAPPRPRPAEPEVTPRDAELAKGHLDAATGHYTNGSRARAVESLGKALALNPALRKDSFAANLITTLTGKSVDEGMRLLVNPDARENLIRDIGGRKPLRKAPIDVDEDVNWTVVGLDVAIYAVILAVVTLAIALVAIQPLIDLFEESLTLSDPSSAATIQADDLRIIRDASLIALIPSAIFYALYGAVGIILQAVGIHFIAITLFGGRATLVYFLHRFVTFQTIVIFIFGILTTITLLTGSTEMIMMMFALMGIANALGVTYYLINLVSSTYGFGWFSGCISIFLGGIFIGVVSYFGLMIFFTLLSGMVELFS